jgi:hypothetical protein
MRIGVWLMALGGLFIAGCSGCGAFINGLGITATRGYSAIPLLINILGILIGISMLSYAISRGSNAGPSAGAYLRDLRSRKYSAAPPIKFHCPACGRAYNGTAQMLGANFVCRERTCGQSFQVMPDEVPPAPPAQ